MVSRLQIQILTAALVRQLVEIIERIEDPAVVVVDIPLHKRNLATLLHSEAEAEHALVQKALTFIQQNVRKGIGVRDVVAYLHVSRPLDDLRFREIRGESVLTTITKVRLDELQRNLSETDEPIESLTRKLGWDSPNYPKNLFKRKFGMTMSDYRHRLRSRAVASLLPADM